MFSRSFALPALALVAAAGAVALAKDAEPKPQVTYAKSWDKAVEEAKALNLPLVVHSHGFY
jgi:imidazolonepropionase-like amidohydrolase